MEVLKTASNKLRTKQAMSRIEVTRARYHKTLSAADLVKGGKDSTHAMIRAVELYEKYTRKNDKQDKNKLSRSEWVELSSFIKVTAHESTPEHHSKLDGGRSISSSVLDNVFCVARMEKAIKEIEKRGSTSIICIKCYADAQLKQQGGTDDRMRVNGYILRRFILPMWVCELIDIDISLFFRVQAFGDVENVLEARNLARICKAHKKQRCCIFSKNCGFWYKAFLLDGKPKNVTYVFSSLEENKIQEIPENMVPFVDHRFTVFTRDYLSVHPEVVINCGGRSCRNCMACYKKNSTFDIFEEEK